jgi:hypothetical protein
MRAFGYRRCICLNNLYLSILPLLPLNDDALIIDCLPTRISLTIGNDGDNREEEKEGAVGTAITAFGNNGMQHGRNKPMYLLMNDNDDDVDKDNDDDDVGKDDDDAGCRQQAQCG